MEMPPSGYLFHVSHYVCSSAGDRKSGGARCRDNEVVSMEFSSISAVHHQRNKSSVVRIVLASGIVELYAGAVSAKLVMERYPGLCLARPEVFKRPHESLVRPWERLLPGHKFLLVPKSTFEKLTQNIRSKEERIQMIARKVTKEKEEREEEEEEEDRGNSFCSAKDFYASREKWGECFSRRLEKGEEEEECKQKKPLVPPPKRMRRRIGWRPSLSPVIELSTEPE